MSSVQAEDAVRSLLCRPFDVLRARIGSGRDRTGPGQTPPATPVSPHEGAAIARQVYCAEIAAAAVYLASSAADMINGADLLVDGGYTVR